jgi:hypothetical protein
VQGTAYHFGEDAWSFARLTWAGILIARGKSSENVPAAATLTQDAKVNSLSLAAREREPGPGECILNSAESNG